MNILKVGSQVPRSRPYKGSVGLEQATKRDLSI